MAPAPRRCRGRRRAPSLDERLRARVSDLGLAVPCNSNGTLRKEVVGTYGYIAPEILFQVDEEAGASPQSDVYSLACLAFEVLTGEPPYSSPDDRCLATLHATAAIPKLTARRADLPPEFDQVFEQALAKDPKARFQTADAFRHALLEARNTSLEPVRILVADDDDDFREVLEEALGEEFPGAEIECVTDGRQAVAAFNRKPPSVLVLDLQMPNMDGMGVTAFLRARSSEHTPIIVLSASGGPEEWRRLLALGADRFLVKPVNMADVISTIRRAIRERSNKLRSPGGHDFPSFQR